MGVTFGSKGDGDEEEHIDISKIKKKQIREIALIRRYTKPKVDTDNKEFLQNLEADGGRLTNKVAQHAENWGSRSKNFSTIAVGKNTRGGLDGVENHSQLKQAA